MKDIRQTQEWANYLKAIGWKVEEIDDTLIYLKKIPILGWFAKIQRPQVLDQKIIKYIEKKYHPFQFSIEPLKIKNLKLIENCKFKIVNSPSLPTKTIQIDLTKSEKKILSLMHAKTRYNIKIAKRNNITITQSNDIDKFVNFWRNNFEKKRFLLLSQKKNIVALYNSFGKKADLLIAKKDNKIIAGLLLLRTKDTIYYMYAASNNQGRKLFAPTLLTWQALVLGKKYECRIFDFDGIFDERFPIKSWLGFTKFKKGFGGYEIKHPGCYIKTNSIIKI